MERSGTRGLPFVVGHASRRTERSRNLKYVIHAPAEKLAAKKRSAKGARKLRLPRKSGAPAPRQRKAFTRSQDLLPLALHEQLGLGSRHAAQAPHERWSFVLHATQHVLTWPSLSESSSTPTRSPRQRLHLFLGRNGTEVGSTPILPGLLSFSCQMFLSRRWVQP